MAPIQYRSEVSSTCMSGRLHCAGRVLWFGFYGPSILTNGFQPYEQADRIAFLPWAWSDLRTLDLDEGRVATLPSTILGDPLDDGSLFDAGGALDDRIGGDLYRAGMWPENITRAIDLILAPLRERVVLGGTHG